MPTKSKTPYRKRRPRAAKPRARKSVSFNQRVKDVFLKELETKKISHFLGGATNILPLNITASGLKDANYGVHIGNIFNSNNIVVAQGVLQNQRVGRQITNCKLYLKCCIQATFYNPATNTNQFPFEVYCIVYKDKQAPNTSNPEHLKIGFSGESTSISGTPANFMLPYNRARYTVYSNKRVGVFKPMPRDRVEPVASNLQNPTIGSSTNKAYKHFSMRLPCPKTLDFKAATGGQLTDLVSNSHLAIGFYVINGSGVELGATQVRATVFPTTTLYYKDC